MNRIEEAQKKLAEAQAFLDAEIEAVEQWKPKGAYYINDKGKAFSFIDITSCCSSSRKMMRDFGNCYLNKEDAEIASKDDRLRNLIRCYVNDYKGDWVADFNDDKQDKYYLYYSHTNKRYGK